MYLPKNVIKKILEKNGYCEIEEIYLSSECKVTKSTGNLYAYVKEKLGVEGNRIIHIGDNYGSDVMMAKNQGLHSVHFRKATDVCSDKNVTNNLGQLFLKDLPDWQDNLAAMHFLGIRTMLAVVANKYFDNPYRSFNSATDFNADPYFMGYYALGMHLYGVTKWLIDDMQKNKYDSIVFMARDGYLPMEAYKLMSSLYPNIAKEKYLYISRKASIQFVIKDVHDLYKLSEIISWYENTPRNALKYLRNVFEIDDNKLESLCQKENVDLDNKFINESEFYKFISILANNFFNQKQHLKKLEALRKYFNEYFNGKTCTFDIGYSARPELFLSELCEKGIDTYFININQEEAIKHSILGNFELKTFYDYKPKLTGLLRETLFSKCAPSCVEYKIDGENVTEVFESYSQEYQEKFLIKTIQNAALDFVNDMVSIFGVDLERLYYQKYYISMPYEMLLQSASTMDRRVMSVIDFEDDISGNHKISVTERWNKEIAWHNQHTLDDLLNMEPIVPIAQGVDLSNRSKFIKGIYYIMIDRYPLKEKVKQKLKNHKIVYLVSKRSYGFIRKAKNACYNLTTKGK